MSCAKTQVKYVNPVYYVHIAVFLLHCYWNLLRWFKIQISVPKRLCSIMLEICPTLNPTLNLPNRVNKCKTDIKAYLLMQPFHFNFLICRFHTWYLKYLCENYALLIKTLICKFVWKGVKGVRVLLPLVFVSFGNCSNMKLLVHI